MKYHESKQSAEIFNIWINPEVAFSMVYEDSIGKLLFNIEIGDDLKKIYLNCLPSENGRIANMDIPTVRIRVEQAIKRLEMYFKNQGLCVEKEI